VFVIHTILVGLGYAETKSVNLTSHGVTKHIYEYSGLPEIYAQHLGGRVLVRHIDGPDTSTSSHVKDTLWVSHYRCFMQLSVEHLKHDLVGEVHPSQINIPVEAGDISNIRISHTDLAQSMYSNGQWKRVTRGPPLIPHLSVADSCPSHNMHDTGALQHEY
jgi:hypothetical protein